MPKVSYCSHYIRTVIRRLYDPLYDTLYKWGDYAVNVLFGPLYTSGVKPYDHGVEL